MLGLKHSPSFLSNFSKLRQNKYTLTTDLAPVSQKTSQLETLYTHFTVQCPWGRLAKLPKRAVRITANSKYNAHTEPLSKDLPLLKITDIFDVQCIKFWYKFPNNTLPNYFRSMFQYNSSLYDIETRNHDRMHVFPTRTFGARNILRHRIPELVYQFPVDMIRKAQTNS